MAKRNKRKKVSMNSSVWLVTFSDLITLLLTFFVLLLSMSSMDTAALTRISLYTSGAQPISLSSSGRVPERIEIVIKMLKDPRSVMEKPQRIKDLLFPLDILPADLPSGDLEKNLEILAHPEGVVIVLTDSLLFSEGSAKLGPNGEKLIDALTPVILSVNADTNISGFSNDPGSTVDNDELSALRALSVLERFLQGGIKPDRFSISGYGADRPLFPTDTEEGRSKNRRVEILLKTTPRLGGYTG